MGRPEMHLSQYMTTKDARHTMTGSLTESGEIVFPARPTVPLRTSEKYDFSETDADESKYEAQDDLTVLVGSILVSAAMD